jgi:hypothetical protein
LGWQRAVDESGLNTVLIIAPPFERLRCVRAYVLKAKEVPEPSFLIPVPSAVLFMALSVRKNSQEINLAFFEE